MKAMHCQKYGLVKKSNQPRRCGQASIELVMSLLMFVIMLGTLLSLSMYMYLNHTFLAAAKEGARMGSVETGLAQPSGSASYNTSVQNVKNWVKNFSNSAGVTLADSNVTLTGPTGTAGNRTITVTVNYSFDNPIQIRTFINRLSGGSLTGLDTFTITNTATMRYEE